MNSLNLFFFFLEESWGVGELRSWLQWEKKRRGKGKEKEGGKEEERREGNGKGRKEMKGKNEKGGEKMLKVEMK